MTLPSVIRYSMSMADKQIPWTQARREALEELVAKARPTGYYGYHEAVSYTHLTLPTKRIV